MNPRTILLFLGTFLAGAVLALVARAALYRPHVDHSGHPAAGGDYAPMVSNPLAPADGPASAPAKPAAPVVPAAKTAAVEDHSQHGAAPAKAAKGQPVNTVCAICGMPVDRKLPTVEYQGQTIGFGCKMCPPKFKAEPDRYGPAYLRNEVIKR